MASLSPNQTLDLEQEDQFDYSKRSQWLRAAVLGANDGLVSTASLMMGVGAVKQDIKAMILTGFAGLVAGACSMAIGEFVSVYSQLDIELAQLRRNNNNNNQKTCNNNINNNNHSDNSTHHDHDHDGCNNKDDEKLPNPIHAAAASALAFSIGAMVPLLAASFVKDYKIRVGVIVAAVSVALAVFGWLGAVLGRAPVVKAAMRVVVGGWLAMGVTFGLTKLIGSRRL